VDQVLDKYVEALGGKEATEGITTRVMKGIVEGITNVVVNEGGPRGFVYAGHIVLTSWDPKIERPVMQTFEIKAKAPNKRSMRTDTWYTDVPTPERAWAPSLAGFDGAVGWTRASDSGVRQEREEDLAKLSRDSDFYREVRLKELHPDLRVKGKGEVNGEAVYVLESNPSQQCIQKLAFSTQTGLLLWEESEYACIPYGFAWGVRPRIRSRVEYLDYQTTDGIKLPVTWRCTAGPANGGPTIRLTFKATEIKLNVPLDDTLFEMPAK
jgi:hypothetical protein